MPGAWLKLSAKKSENKRVSFVILTRPFQYEFGLHGRKGLSIF